MNNYMHIVILTHNPNSIFPCVDFEIIVTCKRQPALGCVYKLVEINGKPKIKLSQEVEKVTMPGKKIAYRLYSDDGLALIDLMQRPEEKPPEAGKRVLCRHPFQVLTKRNLFT